MILDQIRFPGTDHSLDLPGKEECKGQDRSGEDIGDKGETEVIDWNTTLFEMRQLILTRKIVGNDPNVIFLREELSLFKHEYPSVHVPRVWE